MAIRALNTLVVANYNTAAAASFFAGDALMISVTDGTVSAGFRAATGFTTIAQQLGRFVGFSADDTARTGNTMILADPVGSSYTDSSGVLQANNNGFYVVSKRAIGDFLAENVNGVTNPAPPAPGKIVFNTFFKRRKWSSACPKASLATGLVTTNPPIVVVDSKPILFNLYF